MKIRHIILFTILLASTIWSQAQQVNPVPDYVFRNQMSVGRNAVTDTAAYFSIGPRYGANKGFMPPIVGDTATFSSGKRNGLLIFSVQKNKFLYWDSVGVKWAEMAGTAGTALTSADTAALLSTRAWRQKGIDSLAAIRIAGSGTTNYVPKFTAGTTIGNSQIFDNGTNVGIGTITPNIYSLSGYRHLTLSTNVSNQYAGIISAGSGVGGGELLLGNQTVLHGIVGSINGSSLAFYTNGANSGTSVSERLRIFANGRIGINTTTDAGYQLDINGTLRSVNGANFATSSGNVGIGTASPSSLGKVGIQTDGGTGAGVGIYSPSTTNGAKITLFDNINNAGIYGSPETLGTNLVLQTNGTEKVRVTYNGNVGIGSVTPTSYTNYRTLSIAGATSGAVIDMNTSSGVTAGGFQIAATSTNTDFLAYGPQSGTGSYFTFQTGTYGSISEKMRITPSGNVGIGTASPAYKLDVNGSIYGLQLSTGSLAEAGGLMRFNNASGNANSRSWRLANDVVAYGDFSIGQSTTQTGSTFDNTRFYISNTGNVGIGTASPAGKLVVVGASSNTYISIDNAGSGENYYASNAFQQWQTAGSARMTLTSSGELLINTTTDAGDYKLQVAGNSYVTGNLDVSSGQNVKIGAGVNTANGNGLRIDNAENSSYLTLYPMGSSGFGVGGWANSAVLESVSTNGSLVFSAFNNNVIFQTNGRTERGRINSAGEWLLNSDGTDAGDYKLQVVGNARIGTGKLDIAANDVYGITTSRSGTSVIAHQIYNSNGILYLGAENSTGGGIFTGSSAYAAVIGSGANYPLQFATNNATRATIDTDGDLGIATTTPTEKLDVNGRARIRTIDSTSTAINLLYADVNGVIKKAPVSASGISGSGTTNYLPKFTGSTTLGNSVLYEASSELFVNTTSDQGAYALQVNGSIYNTGQVTRGTFNVIGTSAQISTDSTTNLSPLFLDGQSLTGASAQPLIYGNATWNTSGTPSLIDINLTNTASSSDANYIKITDGTNLFRVTKDAGIITSAPSGGTASKWKLGSVSGGSVSLNTGQYIEVEVAGTTYRLAVVTLD